MSEDKNPRSKFPEGDNGDKQSKFKYGILIRATEDFGVIDVQPSFESNDEKYETPDVVADMILRELIGRREAYKYAENTLRLILGPTVSVKQANGQIVQMNIPQFVSFLVSERLDEKRIVTEITPNIFGPGRGR